MSPAFNVRSYGKVSVEKVLVESGKINTRDVQILIQIQKWWELKHNLSSPEWVVLMSALPDDVAGRGHLAGLSETSPDGIRYSEVSLYHQITVNDKPLEWTFTLVVKILLHENAHYYYQSKGRFKKDKISSAREERIVDATAEKDLDEFSSQHPELDDWLRRRVTTPK